AHGTQENGPGVLPCRWTPWRYLTGLRSAARPSIRGNLFRRHSSASWTKASHARVGQPKAGPAGVSAANDPAPVTSHQGPGSQLEAAEIQDDRRARSLKTPTCS